MIQFQARLLGDSVLTGPRIVDVDLKRLERWMGERRWKNSLAPAARLLQHRAVQQPIMGRLSPLVAASLLLLVPLLGAPAARGQFHTYGQIGNELATVASNFPNIAKRFDLGSTVQGRSMWALHLTSNVNAEEDKPEFRYISTMHGDEIMGVEMCMRLIDYLTSNYGTDPRATNIVDSVDLWIVPTMNPDGFVVGTRGNANGFDLNRNFPDPFTSPNNTSVGRQPETANIMNWASGHSFILAANFHGGALVANYAFDNNPSGSSVYTASPDDDVFIFISEEYSRPNQPMWNSPFFFHGITNGADWFAISGGMQDWSYVYMGTNEVTIEVSEVKTPSPTTIVGFWNDNRESMLAYIETSLIGVRGLVTDASSGSPLDARVTVVGRDQTVQTDPDVGDYHRMLLPGTYDLSFESAGHNPVTISGVVVSTGDATRLNVAMVPEGGLVPAVSQWGLLIIALALMVAGTIIVGRRQAFMTVGTETGELV